ncbi:MAG TPA: sugar phosphate isomerase/epimerase family protein [bacterium]|nr:sugar phosphate isomerase/epimerase family protein [bacterium]
MKLIVFTKSFRERSLTLLMKDIKRMGADGADLTIRDGYHVEPSNMETRLPEVKRAFTEAGLSIPMVTSPGALTDPSEKNGENFIASLAESGIPLVKIGYWVVEGSYRELLRSARKSLQGWSKLSEKYGVKILLHTHSGPYLGSNAAAMMDIVEGCSPSNVGVYLDTAHISFSGEPLFMAFEILKDYLAAIAVKDFDRKRKVEGGKITWQRRIVPMGEGFSEWDALGGLMQKYGFKGPVSFHSEYTGYTLARLVKQTCRDIDFFRTAVLKTEK